jgi:hypothetical protein
VSKALVVTKVLKILVSEELSKSGFLNLAWVSFKHVLLGNKKVALNDSYKALGYYLKIDRFDQFIMVGNHP